MKNFYSHLKSRAVPIAALCFVLIAAILYQSGAFELPFIERSETDLSQDAEGGTQTPNTPSFSDGALNSPNSTTSDSIIDSLNSSNNISNITGGSADTSTDTNAPSGDTQGAKYESFLPIGDFSGYSISYKDYSDSSVLAEISLKDSTLPSTLYGGSKITVEFTSAKDTDDGIPYSKREFASDTAMAVELYMGYIIIDNGSSLSLFSSKGTKLGSFARMSFTPAYTRDAESNPLFYLNSEGFDKFYRYDEDTRSFQEAVYNDELDNRGLYFDYTADFGTSDNKYNRYSAIVTCIVEMTPEEAFEYVDFPTELPPEETESETTSPEETGGETADEETTVSSTGEPPANVRYGSSTTKYTNYTISEDGKTVYVETMERRYAFDIQSYMDSEEYKNNPDDKKLAEYFKYYRLYNFQGGLCATVERDGTLIFRDTNGNSIIERDREYYGQNGRKLLSSYAEPLLRGIDSLGSLYFDRGYVLIRQVDIDSEFTDKFSGDYIFLVDTKGTKFNVPSGYNIKAYSDGVLLLERDGYYGYYSTAGKWIAQPIYTYARPFAEGLGVIGFSDSAKGVIDTEGNLVIPFKYDYISQVSSGVMALHGEDGWKLIAKLEK